MRVFQQAKFIIFLAAAMLAATICVGQESIKLSIHANDAFYVHSGETIGIFSDVENSGVVGSFPNSIINFFGQRWVNNTNSRIVDETSGGFSGQGGTTKFSSITNSLQVIENRNSLPYHAFPNLTIANTGNVSLEGADLIIRKNLNFESGHLILNNRNAILLPNATITGYDNDRFVVTGTGTTGGFLVRNSAGLQASDLIFPIGTADNSYTPTSISYTGTAQDIKVRVFDNVYDKAISGIPDNINYVPKTWNVVYSSIDLTGLVTLSAQHNKNEESSLFASGRSNSFISRYNGLTQAWDKAPATGLKPASLTTGSIVSNAFVNTRSGISISSLNEYFSKSTTVSNLIAGLRIPEGISPNNDGLNDKFVVQNLKPGDRVRLDIYNRWQTLVFRDGDYKNTFDGIGNQKGSGNVELPDGTYYYILNINSEKPITGHIIINR